MSQDVKHLERAKADYFKAKVVMDLMRERVAEVNKPLHDAVEKGLISTDEWATKTTDNEYDMGYDKVLDHFYDARRQLLAVAKEMMEKRATPSQWQQIKTVFETHFIKVQDELVDLTLKWSGR